MAYSSASKKAVMARAGHTLLRESRASGVISTVKSRSTMVFVSSSGRKTVNVKPVTRFK